MHSERKLSTAYKLALSIIAKETGAVSAGYGYRLYAAAKLVATHTFGDAPALDVLFVPGGFGNVALDQANDTSIQTFLRNRFDAVDYLLSVCTGSVFLASSGLLNGHRATTNKMSWDWVTSHGENVTWVPSARWTQDGKIWTSSGVAAGIDMTYAFLKHLYGEDDPVLIRTMNGIEYAPHTDPNWDPFSIVHNRRDSEEGNLFGDSKPSRSHADSADDATHQEPQQNHHDRLAGSIAVIRLEVEDMRERAEIKALMLIWASVLKDEAESYSRIRGRILKLAFRE
ncbi:class I glutamine amidotransferase-like protein [Parachaetomium inaequale]|uniref:Class I glutamine amidotransferase-like protein n=1 Tax=Parachaetomium inaequale TaxID=2588326 RepID=A0AAN6PAG9_9PEZI|nr:class I glutamine amidotransferase-like protein [Parachaetomium inaequale]